MDNRNFYEILGVSEKATSDEITAAKTKLVKKYHPDVNMRKGIDTTAQMQEILEAYSTLIDPDKR
jgi:DnaJ-class molecular chaperone